MATFGIAMLIVMAAALAELAFSRSWAPFYFRRGLPVFSRTLLCTAGRDPILDPDVLSRKFARIVVPSIVFRAIGPQEIAFRERLIQLTLVTYTPVMHGIIRFGDHAGMVTVTGYANVFPLCFLMVAAALCLTGAFPGEFAVSFLAVAVLVLGVCYAIQVWRFGGVSKEVEEQLNAV